MSVSFLKPPMVSHCPQNKAGNPELGLQTSIMWPQPSTPISYHSALTALPILKFPQKHYTLSYLSSITHVIFSDYNSVPSLYN